MRWNTMGWLYMLFAILGFFLGIEDIKIGFVLGASMFSFAVAEILDRLPTPPHTGKE